MPGAWLNQATSSTPSHATRPSRLPGDRSHQLKEWNRSGRGGVIPSAMRSRTGVPLLFATVSLAFAVEPVGAQQTPAPTRAQASLTCTSAATKTVVREFVYDLARG